MTHEPLFWATVAVAGPWCGGWPFALWLGRAAGRSYGERLLVMARLAHPGDLEAARDYCRADLFGTKYPSWQWQLRAIYLAERRRIGAGWALDRLAALGGSA